MLPLEGEYCKLFRYSKVAKVLLENRGFLWWLVPYLHAFRPITGRMARATPQSCRIKLDYAAPASYRKTASPCGLTV